MSSVAHLLPVPLSQPSKELDGYQLVARLGRGGMAEIMLASRPGRHGAEVVVVKRLHEEDADDPVILRMFLDESRLSLRFRHPNTVRADALGLIEDRQALIMEFLEGQPLTVFLKRCAGLGRVLPLELIVPAFADVLDGLHYAHELAGDDGRALGVVHRDVSPHNLFVTSLGNLKLLDFGIAKTRIQENRTRTGLLKGKVAYMAPEQAHGARLDRRADIWSAGVTLWEAIAGTRLFKADNEAASLRLTLSGPIARLSELRPEVPPELDEIVMRALRRDPAGRFPTAGAMATALRAWAQETQRPAHSAPLKGVMKENELFGRDIAEQRLRVHALLTASENVPPSGSMPALSTSVPASGGRRVVVADAGSASAEAAGVTHISTISEFVDRLHHDQRMAFRWMFVVMGLLALAVVGLGATFAARWGEAPLAAAAPSAGLGVSWKAVPQQVSGRASGPPATASPAAALAAPLAAEPLESPATFAPSRPERSPHGSTSNTPSRARTEPATAPKKRARCRPR